MLRQSCLHPVRLLTRTDAELCNAFHSFFLLNYMPQQKDVMVVARFPRERAQIDTIESGLKLFLLDQIIHAGTDQEISGKFVVTSSDGTRYFAFFRSYAGQIVVAVSQLSLMSFAREVLQLLGEEEESMLEPILLSLVEIPILPITGMHYDFKFSGNRSAALKFSCIEQVEDGDIDFVALSVFTPMMLVKSWEAIILERKVLVVSECDSLVIACCEFLRRLVLPLVVVNTYVPLLPLQLIDAIDAPFPYLLGVNLYTLREHSFDLGSTVIIDVDAKVVVPGQKVEESEKGLHQKNGASHEMITALVQEVNDIMVHPLANWFSRPSTKGKLPHCDPFSPEAHVARAAQVVQVFVAANLNLIGARHCTVAAFWRDPCSLIPNYGECGSNSAESTDASKSQHDGSTKVYDRYSGGYATACASNRSAVNHSANVSDNIASTSNETIIGAVPSSSNDIESTSVKQRRNFDFMGYHFQRGVISGFAQLSKDVHRDVNSLTEFLPCWVEMDYSSFSVYLYADDLPVIYISNLDIESVSPCPAEPEGHVLELVVKDQSTFRLTMTDAQSRQRWIAAIDRRRQEDFKWESEALIEERINESIELEERRPDYLGGGYYASAFRKNANANDGGQLFAGMKSSFHNPFTSLVDRMQQNQSQQQQRQNRSIYQRLGRKKSDTSPYMMARSNSIANATEVEDNDNNDENDVNFDMRNTDVVGDELMSGENGKVDPYRYGSPAALGLTPSLRSAHYMRHCDKADCDFRYSFAHTQMMTSLHSHLECVNFNTVMKEQNIKISRMSAAPVNQSLAGQIEDSITLLIKHSRNILGMDREVCGALRQLQNEISTMLGAAQADALKNSLIKMDKEKMMYDASLIIQADTTSVKIVENDSSNFDSTVAKEAESPWNSGNSRRTISTEITDKELRQSLRLDSTNLNVPSRFSIHAHSLVPATSPSRSNADLRELHTAFSNESVLSSPDSPPDDFGDESLPKPEAADSRGDDNEGTASSMKANSVDIREDSAPPNGQQRIRRRTRIYRALFQRRSSDTSFNTDVIDITNAERNTKERRSNEAAKFQAKFKEGDRKSSNASVESLQSDERTTLEQLQGALNAMLYFITSTHRRLQAEINTLIVEERMRVMKGAADTYNLTIQGYGDERSEEMYKMSYDISSIAKAVVNCTASKVPTTQSSVKDKSATSESNVGQWYAKLWFSLVDSKFSTADRQTSSSPPSAEDILDEIGTDVAVVNLTGNEIEELIDEDQQLQKEVQARKHIRKKLLESINTAIARKRHLEVGSSGAVTPIFANLMGLIEEAMGDNVDAIKSYARGCCLADQQRLMTCIIKHFIERKDVERNGSRNDNGTGANQSGGVLMLDMQNSMDDGFEFVRWAHRKSKIAGIQAFRLQLELMYRELLSALDIDEFSELAKDQQLGSFRIFPGSALIPGIAAQRSEKLNTKSRYASLKSSDFTWTANPNPSDALNEMVICSKLNVERSPCQLSVLLLSYLREILKTFCKSPSGAKLCRKSPSGLTKLKVVPSLTDTIASSSAFKAFQLQCSMLQMVNLHGMSIDERVLFFCNTYNIIMVHAIIIKGNPGVNLLERSAFMRSSKYNIGGSMYSLIEIEHGILRHSSTKAMIFGPLTLSINFTEKDPRRKMVLEEARPNITFCLFTASIKSPSLVVLKDPRTVNDEMRKYARRFFLEHVKLDAANHSIGLPGVMKVYWADFGGTRGRVLRVVSQLSGSQFAANLKPYCSSNSEGVKPKVEFAPLEWTPMIVLHDV